MGKPCESVEVRLRSVESQDTKYQTPKGKNVRPHTATVSHIINSAKYSYINESLARKLLLKTFGPNGPAIKFGNDTIIELDWHYPGENTPQTTKHLVMRESKFQITLRKEDWEQPMLHFLRKKFPEKQFKQRQALTPQEVQKADAKAPETKASDIENHDCGKTVDHESEYESDTESALDSSFYFSRSSTATTNCGVGECTQMGTEEHGRSHKHSHKHEYAASSGEDTKNEELGKPQPTTQKANEAGHNSGIGPQNKPRGVGELGEPGEDENGDEEEDDDWLQFELIDTDSEDAEPDDPQEDAYWTWSKEKSQWFHEGPDGTTVWFSKLV